jgi:hypothetical protein
MGVVDWGRQVAFTDAGRGGGWSSTVAESKLLNKVKCECTPVCDHAMWGRGPCEHGKKGRPGRPVLKEQCYFLFSQRRTGPHKADSLGLHKKSFAIFGPEGARFVAAQHSPAPRIYVEEEQRYTCSTVESVNFGFDAT